MGLLYFPGFRPPSVFQPFYKPLSNDDGAEPSRITRQKPKNKTGCGAPCGIPSARIVAGRPTCFFSARYACVRLIGIVASRNELNGHITIKLG